MVVVRRSDDPVRGAKSQLRLRLSGLSVRTLLGPLLAAILSGCTTTARFDAQTAGLNDVLHSVSTSIDDQIAELDESSANTALATVAAPSHDLRVDQKVEQQSIELASFNEPQPIPPVEAIDPVPVPLSLMDAINATTLSNPRIRVLSYLPLEAATQAEIEKARFDTTFSGGTQVLHASQQVGSAVQATTTGAPTFNSMSIGPANNLPNLVQVEKRFSSGTVARIGANSTYNQNSPAGQFLVYNPAYQSGMSAVVEQPLLRGFGSKNNLAGTRIAMLGQKQSVEELQSELNRTINEVQLAYWQTWLAQSEVETYDELVGEAELTVQLEEKRLEVGEGSRIELFQAQENLESLRVDRELSNQQLRTAENRLKSLMGRDADDQQHFEFVDIPFEIQFTPSLEEGLELARRSRPELKSQQLALQQAQLDVDRSKNHARPDLNAYAGYGLTGLNSGLLGSLTDLTSTQYGNASAGVRVQHVFGRRAEKAAVERAELTLQRQLLAVRETQQQIEQQVRQAYDAIGSAWEVLQRQQTRTEAARTQYQTARQLHQSGDLDLDRLIRSRTLLAQALQQKQAALIDYNLALTNWNYVIGVTTGQVLENSQ